MSDATNADELLAALRAMPDPSERDPGLRRRIESRLALSIGGLLPVVKAGSEAGLDPAATAHSGSGAHPDPKALVTPRGSEQTDPNALATPRGGDLGTPSALTAARNGALGSASVLVASKNTVLAWLVPVFVAGAVVGVTADRWYLRHRKAADLSTRNLDPSTTDTRLFDSATSSSKEGSPSSRSQPVPQPPYGRIEDQAVTRDDPIVAKAATSSAASAAPVDSLTTEREILDAARTALARGEPQSGIAALKKHTQRFPRGTLSEEREALYVRILVAMGNDESAKARAARFQRQFPNSIFMPVIDRALMTISRRSTEGDPKP